MHDHNGRPWQDTIHNSIRKQYENNTMQFNTYVRASSSHWMHHTRVRSFKTWNARSSPLALSCLVFSGELVRKPVLTLESLSGELVCDADGLRDASSGAGGTPSPSPSGACQPEIRVLGSWWVSSVTLDGTRTISRRRTTDPPAVAPGQGLFNSTTATATAAIRIQGCSLFR